VNETMSAPVVLRPVNMAWIKGALDDPADLCAHGHVEFRVGDRVLIDPATGPEVTVSAAALYLLRTLSRPHTKAQPVGEQLFPCCGFTMYDIEGQEDVLVIGCPSGIDFQVLHADDQAVIVAGPDDLGELRVGRSTWVEAVNNFADLVAGFYARSSPKKPSAEDAAGFAKFGNEWQRRRGRPLTSVPGRV
jgi:hypothetical protein